MTFFQNEFLEPRSHQICCIWSCKTEFVIKSFHVVIVVEPGLSISMLYESWVWWRVHWSMIYCFNWVQLFLLLMSLHLLVQFKCSKVFSLIREVHHVFRRSSFDVLISHSLNGFLLSLKLVLKDLKFYFVFTQLLPSFLKFNS